MTLSGTALRFVCLATLFVFFFQPTAGASQDAEVEIAEAAPTEIELVGVAVEIEDGESIGDGCKWYADDRPPGKCIVTRGTFEGAGIPTVAVSGLSLARGVAGAYRFRMIGRVTRLRFHEGQEGGTVDTGFEYRPPVEERIATDGTVLPNNEPPPRVRSRVRVPARSPRVKTTVVWSMYDAVEGEMVGTREAKGSGADLGEAMEDSYLKFIDEMRRRMGDR